ncbi:MAG: hypothetical protein Q7R98_01680 [Candidatus Jorgensenbacteria bacterium]|nr:hypothetical protein [Candidatus Jorgensenbacteria bacterium]
MSHVINGKGNASPKALKVLIGSLVIIIIAVVVIMWIYSAANNQKSSAQQPFEQAEIVLALGQFKDFKLSSAWTPRISTPPGSRYLFYIEDSTFILFANGKLDTLVPGNINVNLGTKRGIFRLSGKGVTTVEARNM